MLARNETETDTAQLLRQLGVFLIEWLLTVESPLDLPSVLSVAVLDLTKIILGVLSGLCSDFVDNALLGRLGRWCSIFLRPVRSTFVQEHVDFPSHFLHILSRVMLVIWFHAVAARISQDAVFGVFVRHER